MNTLDAETSKILSDGEEVGNLINSRGWAIVKTKLDEKILDLQNINNLDTSVPDTLTQQLLGRKLASELLFNWLKNDVIGFAEQQDSHRASLLPKDDHGFIDRGTA